MIIWFFLPLLCLLILGKITGKASQTTTVRLLQAMYWIISLFLAFIVPLFWLRSVAHIDCLSSERLLPTILAGIVLFIYFMRPQKFKEALKKREQ